MPKQAFTISSFKGLQSEYDPRDIEQGALVVADDVFIDKPGKIRLARIAKGYNPTEFVKYDATLGYRGYGLFQYSADYTFAGAVGNTDYLLVQNGSAFVLAENYNDDDFENDDDWKTHDVASTTLDMGGDDTLVKPCYYYVDGALRICDGHFPYTTNINKWLGYIKRHHFEDVSPTTACNYAGWYIRNQEITAPTAGSIQNTSAPSAGSGVYIHIYSNDSTNGNVPQGEYEFASSFVYDSIQESKLYSMSNTVTLSDDEYNFSVGRVAVTNPFNPRISNIFIYCKIKDSDTPFIKILNIDMIEGIYTVDSNTNSAWDDATGEVVTITSAGISLLELSSTTYEMNSGIDANEDNIFAKYKTACIVNRRTYIGNVRIDGVNYGDKMIKSPVNKFDIFPESNNIDVVINDGDEIIKLVALSDRILQFKRKNLYIINVADDYEYIEESYKNHGIDEPFQVCEFENSVAWCNQFGVYIYSGGKLQEISAKIKDAWQAFFVADSKASIPSIGYDARQKKLIIVNAVGYKSEATEETGHAYVFDIVNNAWTKSKTMYAALASGEKLTNFVTDVNGYMLVFKEASTGTNSQVYCIETADNATSNLDITTGDMVINDISIKKRFYGIRLTYKATGTVSTNVNIKLKYGVDGITPASTFNPDASLKCTGTTAVWETVELTPSSISDFYSIALQLYSDGTSAAGFEINDISIIYRDIGVR